jgi:hypothetical protein
VNGITKIPPFLCQPRGLNAEDQSPDYVS